MVKGMRESKDFMMPTLSKYPDCEKKEKERKSLTQDAVVLSLA